MFLIYQRFIKDVLGDLEVLAAELFFLELLGSGAWGCRQGWRRVTGLLLATLFPGCCSPVIYTCVCPGCLWHHRRLFLCHLFALYLIHTPPLFNM